MENGVLSRFVATVGQVGEVGVDSVDARAAEDLGIVDVQSVAHLGAGTAVVAR